MSAFQAEIKWVQGQDLHAGCCSECEKECDEWIPNMRSQPLSSSRHDPPCQDGFPARMHLGVFTRARFLSGGCEGLTFDVCKRTESWVCAKARLVNIFFVFCDKFCLISTREQRSVLPWCEAGSDEEAECSCWVATSLFLHPLARCCAGTSLSALWQECRKGNSAWALRLHQAKPLNDLSLCAGETSEGEEEICKKCCHNELKLLYGLVCSWQKGKLFWSGKMYFYEFICLLAAYIWTTCGCKKARKVLPMKLLSHSIICHLDRGRTHRRSPSVRSSHGVTKSPLFGNPLEHHRAHCRAAQLWQCHFQQEKF